MNENNKKEMFEEEDWCKKKLHCESFSHVQAAYANFLWETEENEDEQSIGKEAATKTYTAAATAWDESEWQLLFLVSFVVE